LARLSLSLFAFLVVCLLASPGWSQQPPPEAILFNGKVFTSDLAHLYVEALAIRGDRIVATGTSEKISALAGPQTKRIDLGGRVVIPGINDAHYHLMIHSTVFMLPLKGMDPTWPEVTSELASALATAQRGTFIVGETGGAVLEDPRATRATLDQLAPDHPVMLATWTQHSAILNTAAIKMLGIKENEPDPKGGWFGRSADGKLTGLAMEFARFRLHRRMSEMASEEEALQQTRDFLNEAVRFGITSVQNMSEPASPEMYVHLLEKTQTPIRVRIMRYLLTDKNGPIDEGRDLPRNPSTLITVSGTKWMLDGTPIERTAAMRQPYSDRPSTTGYLDFPEKDVEAMLRKSLHDDDQVMFHAVGDRAAETLLNAMDATGGVAVWARRRVRIEHGDGLVPELAARAKTLGVVVVVNPTHITLGDLIRKRYGTARAEQFFPFRSLLDLGIPFALGSDGPMNPYLNIMLASTYPGKPREAITREQAVIAYTLTSAYAEFAEMDKGSLEPGKLADLAVLSQDIFHIPAEDLPKTESVLTMVGGKIVYDAKVVNSR